MYQLDHNLPKNRTHNRSMMSLENIKIAVENVNASTQRDLGNFYRKINIQPSLKWFTLTSSHQQQQMDDNDSNDSNDNNDNNGSNDSFDNFDNNSNQNSPALLAEKRDDRILSRIIEEEEEEDDDVKKFEILTEILNDDSINKEASSGELYYKLACMYFHGQGTTKDDIQAYNYFKTSWTLYQNEQAKQMLDPYSYCVGEDAVQRKMDMYLKNASTDIDLQYKLALIYATGITSNDDGSSSSSSNSDNNSGKRDSGKAHYYFIIEKEVKTSLDYFSKAISKDDDTYFKEAIFWKEQSLSSTDTLQQSIESAHISGLLFYYGKGIEKNIPRALECFEIAANQGHHAAQYYLGTVLFEQQQHLELAIEWYKKSIHGPHQQQNMHASYILGLIYYYYKKRSDTDAFYHFKHAVDLGHEDARFYLACLYEDKQDDKHALACYMDIADKNMYACHIVGLFYYYGRGGIEKDVTQAFSYFKKAADQGHSEAQFYLGRMYRDGQHADDNATVSPYEKAIEWFIASADQHNVHASYALGVLYYNHQEYPKALDCFKKAANQGHDRAKYRLGKIYESGKGTDIDLKRAVKWYQRVSDTKLNKHANFRLGVLFYQGGDNENDNDQAVNDSGSGSGSGATTVATTTTTTTTGIDNASTTIEKNIKKSIYHFKLSARQGHAKAEFNLGKIYEDIEQNHEKAIEWYKKSASHNNPEANYTLGFIYYHGKYNNNDEVDYTKALYHFKKAAEKGHSDAQFYLGKMYEDGEGIQANYSKAIEWYTQSKKLHDNVYASYRLGYMYYMGKGIPSDSKKAIQYFHEAAEKRYSDAQFYLGKMYRDGGTADSICSNDLEWDPEYAIERQEYAGYSIGLDHFTGENGVQQDFERAMHYFRLSGKQGHSDAQYHLGLMYETGTGINKKSIPMAVKWYTKSAKQYNMNACFQLALIYHFGKGGIRQSHEQSLHYFRIAANQDHSHAQYYLAVMNQYGIGTHVDVKAAVEWYTRAVHLQNMYAGYTLGLLYYNGEYNKKDKQYYYYQKAMQCFEMAAEQGYSDAYVYLGKIYEDGSGGVVKVDYQKAIECYHQAIDCDQENSFAIYRLGLIYYQGSHSNSTIEKDDEKALCYFEWAAGLGRRDAYYYLGKLYEDDKRKNYKRAIECYSKAIEKKSIHANESLGLMYYHGKGVEQSYQKAFCYLKVAADQGLSIAQFYLGHMLEQGLGLTPHFKEAIDWYIRSAAQNNSEASYRLGLIYRKGKEEKKDHPRRVTEKCTFEKDDQKSFSYFKAAAEQGHSDAQYHLGEMYEIGIVDHISVDYKESIRWYQSAASQQNMHAAYRLGLLFYEGKHVKQDDVKAKQYFQMASDQGHINAKRYLGGRNEGGDV